MIDDNEQKRREIIIKFIPFYKFDSDYKLIPESEDSSMDYHKGFMALNLTNSNGKVIVPLNLLGILEFYDYGNTKTKMTTHSGKEFYFYETPDEIWKKIRNLYQSMRNK